MTDRRTAHERGWHIPAGEASTGRPVRDLGPVSAGATRHAFDHRGTEPAGVFEAVELASMMAEGNLPDIISNTFHERGTEASADREGAATSSAATSVAASDPF